MKRHYRPALLVALITLGNLSVEVFNPLIAPLSAQTTCDSICTDAISYSGRFRRVQNWASTNGFVSGFPNFHQADYKDGRGVVFGTVLLRSGVVTDVPASELNDPQDDGTRFREVNDWASRNGYAGGFPNFHQANYGDGRGVVYGVVLLTSDIVERRDIHAVDLGYPTDDAARIRAVNDWATRNGYAGGFPNFHQADSGRGLVYGVVLIKQGAAQQQVIPLSALRL